MNIEIITKELHLDVYGFSGIASNKDYAGTAFQLMDKMWKIVKAKGLKNKGLNIWIYESNNKVFAGVELDDSNSADNELERKTITLTKYAYCKHIGPYNLIKQSGQKMRDELISKGYTITQPYIEVYGHWQNDESKLETELFMNLE